MGGEELRAPPVSSCLSRKQCMPPSSLGRSSCEAREWLQRTFPTIVAPLAGMATANHVGFRTVSFSASLVTWHFCWPPADGAVEAHNLQFPPTTLVAEEPEIFRLSSMRLRQVVLASLFPAATNEI